MAELLSKLTLRIYVPEYAWKAMIVGASTGSANKLIWKRNFSMNRLVVLILLGFGIVVAIHFIRSATANVPDLCTPICLQQDRWGNCQHWKCK